MAVVTLPTVDQIITRFPKLEGQAELIEAIIPEAARAVDGTWNPTDATTAIMYLVAHMVTVEGESEDGRVIASEGFGPLSVSYVDDGRKDNPLRATTYGQRYLELLKANRGGPVVV